MALTSIPSCSRSNLTTSVLPFSLALINTVERCINKLQIKKTITETSIKTSFALNVHLLC